MTKTCNKCKGSAYTAYDTACTHDFAEPPVPGLVKVYLHEKKERVWQATLRSGAIVRHPLREEVIKAMNAPPKEQPVDHGAFDSLMDDEPKLDKPKNAEKTNGRIGEVWANKKTGRDYMLVRLDMNGIWAALSTSGTRRPSVFDTDLPGHFEKRSNTYDYWLVAATGEILARKMVADALREMGWKTSEYIAWTPERRALVISKGLRPA